MRAHNATLASRPPGLVAVFTGATRGIGAETLRQLLTHLAKPTVYMVGRSLSKFADKLAELRALNEEATIEFIEADVTLLGEVNRAADVILGKVHHVDIVCMSQGHLPTPTPNYTKEDVEQCMALSYYGRVLLITRLLPALEKASRPRVLSILAGGEEKRLWLDDPDLRGNYGESGERFAFLLTSGRYAARREGVGDHDDVDVDVVNGLYLLDKQGEVKVNRDLLGRWMGDGSVDRVWEHTMRVLERGQRA
ncbi:hypothetical protein HIM_00928 [Hirsutella minnesotensis 3608]|nr:hypothetical protein HIM_00928 [Hirsutella minnesotensis 3608]